MCLIVLAVDQNPEFPLIMLANRDEFYSRPTAPLQAWHDTPEIIAGRDLQHQGTWAAWHRDGRLAALTNIRRPGAMKPGKYSRGELVVDCVQGDDCIADILAKLAVDRTLYAPFNLILGRPGALFYFSSDTCTPEPVTTGIHGLSNAGLNTPWPKLEYAKHRLRRALSGHEPLTDGELFECVLRTEGFPDSELPDTGVPHEWERILSSPFIVSSDYGTRSTLLLKIDRQGSATVSERSYLPEVGPAIFSQRTFRG